MQSQQQAKLNFGGTTLLTGGKMSVPILTLAVKSTLEFQALYLICFGVCYRAVNTERAGGQLKIDDSHYSRGS